jgi:predicted  nucleic acid-binding Zn-ribbon protein
MRNPKMEHMYDFIEPGADQAITDELNKIGTNDKEGVTEAEIKSIQDEFKEREKNALRHFKENYKTEKLIDRLLSDFKLFINKTLIPERTQLDVMINDFQKGTYDKDFFKIYENQLGNIPVVIPLFDFKNFLEMVDLAKTKGIITESMTLEEILESLNKRINEVKEEIDIAKDWHRAYQAGIVEQKNKVDAGLDKLRKEKP